MVQFECGEGKKQCWFIFKTERILTRISLKLAGTTNNVYFVCLVNGRGLKVSNLTGQQA